MRVHALVLLAAGCAALPSAAAAEAALPEVRGDILVEVREEALPARPRRDRWSGAAGGATASWDDSGAAVTLKRGRGAIRPDHQIPRSPMLPCVTALVVKTSGAVPGDGASIAVSLKENSRDKGREQRSVTASAPWFGGETRVPFDLPADADGWHVEKISFDTGGVADATFHFLGVDAVTRETPATALRLDIETGNPMRLVRRERGERPALVLRNPTGVTRHWRGEVVAEDFFGAAATSRLDIAIAPGGAERRDFAFPQTQGIMFVRARVDCEGTEATHEARFAVVEAQDATPPQPEGEFRLGVNWHITRYTPVDRAITTAAAVAIGAKIMRGNFATFGTCEPREGEFNWADTDHLVDSLATNGIAIDAILTGFPKWAYGEGGSLRPGALRDYAAVLAARYGTRIAWYELGNEWDMKHTSLPEALRLLREVHDGVKSACPAAKVIPPGFAAESSVRHPPAKIRPGFHEGLMTEGQHFCDAHPVHIHSPYREFAGKVDFLLRWRRERGVTVPWYANETAVSVVRVGERVAAETVWRKILHAWSRGSVDYIWYNLRATGWHPRDPEQGYGLFTADYRPRATAAAFAALSANFRHLASDGVLRDGPRRQVMRFAGSRGGRRLVAIAGWDELARGPMPIRVATDATEAWTIDLMGNHRPIVVGNNAATWEIGSSPSAIFLADATFAEPNAADLAADAPDPGMQIAPGPDFRKAPDLVLRDPEQVFDLWEAVPDKASRTWKWWGDLLAGIFFARGGDGRIRVRVVVEDDIHAPDAANPLNGDAAVLRIGDRRVVLFDGGPEGIVTRVKGGKSAFGNHYCGATAYEYSFDPSDFGFGPGDEIPFNVRVYENDGEGPDGWIEWRPFDEPPPVRISDAGDAGPR